MRTRKGKRFVHCEADSRVTEIDRKFWTPIIQAMIAYEQFVPEELHVQSKAKTYVVDKVIITYSGIFSLGCAENQNAIAKARIC